MANLAIKGHKTRGDEVINILRMLGGYNKYNYVADYEKMCFYIGVVLKNIYYDSIDCLKNEDAIIFTLEEFLEKFPYKVGDKVQHKGATSCVSVFEVEKMRWVGNHVEYTIRRLWYNNCRNTVTVEHLQPYKEENMEEKLEQIILDIPNGYEFFGVNDDNKVVLAKKQPQYPKTFIEVLNFLHPYRQIEDDYQRCYKKDLIEKFQDLLYARDAYWKIAWEQMGLGKPWVLPFHERQNDEPIYFIVNKLGEIYTDSANIIIDNRILAFPTEEMRDSFYENFEELIEECKCFL